MKKRILRLKLHCDLQIGNRAGEVGLLQQRPAKFGSDRIFGSKEFCVSVAPGTFSSGTLDEPIVD
jgi:hypothetical protein